MPSGALVERNFVRTDRQIHIIVNDNQALRLFNARNKIFHRLAGIVHESFRQNSRNFNFSDFALRYERFWFFVRFPLSEFSLFCKMQNSVAASVMPRAFVFFSGISQTDDDVNHFIYEYLVYGM